MFCGCGNVEDENGDIGPFLATPIDRNWGDSCYICEDCGVAIGAQFGSISPDEAKDLKRELKKKAAEIHELESELDRRRIRETRSRKAVSA
jgi:hypothetical protein